METTNGVTTKHQWRDTTAAQLARMEPGGTAKRWARAEELFREGMGSVMVRKTLAKETGFGISPSRAAKLRRKVARQAAGQKAAKTRQRGRQSKAVDSGESVAIFPAKAPPRARAAEARRRCHRRADGRRHRAAATGARRQGAGAVAGGQVARGR